MFKNIRNKVATLLSLATLVAVPLVAAPAFAAPAVGGAAAQSTDNPIQDNLCNSVNTLKTDSGDSSSCKDTNGGTSSINNIITTIINIFSIVVGVVAVIMIILGGFRYITSGGDSNNITSAKNTIIYALIGLVVVALAQFIVQFVLNKVTQ